MNLNSATFLRHEFACVGQDVHQHLLQAVGISNERLIRVNLYRQYNIDFMKIAHGVLDDVLDLGDGLNWREEGLNGIKSVVLDQVLVEKVFHAAKYKFCAVCDVLHHVGHLLVVKAVGLHVIGELEDVL